MTLFEDIESQYIDDNGKTRVLNYQSGVSLMTSPLPPLNVPISKEIREIAQKTALKFIKAKGLQITMQDGNQQKIQGLWVESINSEIYYGYIPIKVSNPLSNIDYTPLTLNDPLRTGKNSELQKMQHDRKVADYLKQYTLFEYSQNPKKFSEENFIVIPDHKYDIETLDKKLIPDNNVMYRDGKLIVLSEDIADRLTAFLQVQLLNDTPGLKNYKDRTVIKDYYRTLSDFRKSEGQLVFLTRSSLLKWKSEKIRIAEQTLIVSYIRPTFVEPYFFRNTNVAKGRLMLIQNVENGSLEKALTVAEKWAKDRVNPGFRVEIGPAAERVTYTVYTKDGEEEVVKPSGKEEHVSVIKYPNNEYAALLFFKTK
uniref:Uncharacterized protein n=1 Tax=Marseillevirus LCMAC102 TaxID=2506603 RepID=A0A481YT10_9VIRU|nr:MAG: hypothetical protein LCMAC102_00030 [Marseillevirus LCMAC102]